MIFFNEVPSFVFVLLVKRLIKTQQNNNINNPFVKLSRFTNTFARRAYVVSLRACPVKVGQE